jgi:hypothetical protein
MKVEIIKGVNYEGTLYDEGKVYEVSKDVGEGLIKQGWAKVAK